MHTKKEEKKFVASKDAIKMTEFTNIQAISR